MATQLTYTLLVKSSPYTSQSSYTAYRFAEAVLSQGYFINQVFFYEDGVYNGSPLLHPPENEMNLCKSWQALIKKHNLACIVCSAAAQRRGIVDKENSEGGFGNLAEGFIVAGLGKLMEAIIQADRFLEFAG